MRTQPLNAGPTDAQPAPRAPAAVDEHGPVALCEAELAYVAAAGSKIGIAGGCNKEQS